jgi:hypothetical protein
LVADLVVGLINFEVIARVKSRLRRWTGRRSIEREMFERVPNW